MRLKHIDIMQNKLQHIFYTIVAITLIFILSLYSSCDNVLVWDASACDDCVDEKPDVGMIELHFTINERFTEVPFVILAGEYESADTVHAGSAITKTLLLPLSTNKEFCFAAYYHYEGKTRIVINQGEIKTYHINCGDEYDSYKCWSTPVPVIDLTFKD